MKKVLIVIDAQEDFTRGALRNDEAINALPVVKSLVDYAYENDFKVFYTMDTHHADTYPNTQEGRNLPVVHCVERTPGWQICPEVLKAAPVQYDPHRVILLKNDAFGTMDWQRFSAIREAEEIWVCGFCTDICVVSNFMILKALYPQIPIKVFSNACAGVTPELHKAALNVMGSCQGIVTEWENE